MRLFKLWAQKRRKELIEGGLTPYLFDQDYKGPAAEMDQILLDNAEIMNHAVKLVLENPGRPLREDMIPRVVNEIAEKVTLAKKTLGLTTPLTFYLFSPLPELHDAAVGREILDDPGIAQYAAQLISSLEEPVRPGIPPDVLAALKKGWAELGVKKQFPDPQNPPGPPPA